VELIGRNSNLGHLGKKWAELQEQIVESSPRPDLSGQDIPKSRSKRFLTAQDVADIVARYEAGETTQQIGNRYSISKTRVASVLREEGITVRRKGLSDEQVSEAATLYANGKSLAWLGTRFNVSHTTVATALRRQGVQLRPRPGWARRHVAPTRTKS
jgi:Mor family transcriptional regulator